MCRGNFAPPLRFWRLRRAGDAIFNRTDVDIYFMEYDTDAPAGWKPLKLLPKGKKRVMAGSSRQDAGTGTDDWLRRSSRSLQYATWINSVSRRNAASPPRIMVTR